MFEFNFNPKKNNNSVVPPKDTKHTIAREVSKEMTSSITGHRIDLPSHGVFYKDKKDFIVVDLLRIKHIELIYSALTLSEDFDKEERIASVINDCIKDYSAYDLTLDDYKYVLYWLRFNSYPRNPFFIKYTRILEDKTEKVVTVRVNQTDLNIKELKNEQRPLFPWLSYTTVQDNLYYLKHKKELNLIMEYFSFVNGKSPEEKISFYKNLDADSINDIKSHIIEFYHGVTESITTFDPEDPKKEEVKLEFEFDLASFFP